MDNYTFSYLVFILNISQLDNNSLPCLSKRVYNRVYLGILKQYVSNTVLVLNLKTSYLCTQFYFTFDNNFKMVDLFYKDAE